MFSFCFIVYFLFLTFIATQRLALPLVGGTRERYFNGSGLSQANTGKRGVYPSVKCTLCWARAEGVLALRLFCLGLPGQDPLLSIRPHLEGELGG